MATVVRSIDRGEFDAFNRVAGLGFGGAPSGDAYGVFESELIEFERTRVVEVDGRMAATSANYTFELTVPGGAIVRAGGLTWISVVPAFRRRGLLRLLMNELLDDSAQRGECVSMLHASESSIYGRFGFGPATSAVTYEIARPYTAFAQALDVPGSVCYVDRDEAAARLAPVYEQARRRPGMLDRPARDWTFLVADHVAPGDDADRGARQDVAYVEGGVALGYATYRYIAQWRHALAGGESRIEELVANTPAAYAALWRYCFDLDLSDRTVAIERPHDEPVRWLLAEPRRLEVKDVHDALWLRLLDVPTALEARRYGATGALVIEVRDDFRPTSAGRFELEVSDDAACCRPTSKAPDLTLGAAELGAIYLGGIRLSTLAWADRVEAASPAALARAEAMFRGDVEPWCVTDF